MSLFDTIMSEGDNNASDGQSTEANGEAGNNGTNEPTWWYDKATPGTGERPDWLPAQFKSAEDAARSYSELAKKLGTAPDKYDFTKGESWIDPEYEPFQELAELAKSKHVSQDVMDKMFESVGKYLDEFNINYEEERAALGENAMDRLKLLNNWAKSNFSDDAYKALTSNLKTADSVKALEEVRNKMIESNTVIPTGNEVAAGAPTLKDVQQEMRENFAKYKTDDSYRAYIQKKIANATAVSGAKG